VIRVGWHLVVMLVFLLVVAAIVVGAVLLVRFATRPDRQDSTPPDDRRDRGPEGGPHRA